MVEEKFKKAIAISIQFDCDIVLTQQDYLILLISSIKCAAGCRWGHSSFKDLASGGKGGWKKA